MITFGSGQTNGLPLAVTATPTVLHTAPVGAATPARVSFRCTNSDVAAHTLTLALVNSSGTTVESFVAVIPARALNFDVLAPAPGGFPVAGALPSELVLNGTAVIKASADAAGFLSLSARVDDQANVAGVASQVLASGLIAAVQNATRYGVGVQGGTGTATIANAQIKMSRAGVLKNFRTSADAAVGTTAVVTSSVYVNGVATALSVTLAAADGTADKLSTASVAVNAGDLVTFGNATTNVSPAANIHAACDLV